MAKTSLPPGFRFHPTDDELVSYYLKRKVMGKPLHFQAISEVELYKFSPWDLPEKSILKCRDLEWYFFCPRDKKYLNGSRANRSTETGYWKTTGKDRTITHNSRVVGMKKSLIFHLGKPPRGDRTDWVMYEYRLHDNNLLSTGFAQDSYVVCKIFKKSGAGPRIGEQYGAPFNEDEWDSDGGAEVDAGFSLPLPRNLCGTPPEQSSLDDSNAAAAALPVEPVRTGAIQAAPPVPADVSMPDMSELDGVLLDELESLLNDSPPRFGNSGLLYQPGVPENDEYALDMTAEGNYNELLDLVRGTNPLADNYENAPQPTVMSELDSQQYVELNDLFFSELQLDIPFEFETRYQNQNRNQTNQFAQYRLLDDPFPSCPPQLDDLNNSFYTDAPISEFDHVAAHQPWTDWR